MNVLYTFLSIILIGSSSYAQSIDIPDSEFLNYLISEGYDTNNDGLIQVTEAEAILEIDISGIFGSIEGIKEFPNLRKVGLDTNVLPEVDLSGITSLEEFEIQPYYIGASDINLEGCTSLFQFTIGMESTVTKVNLSGCSSLMELNVLDDFIHFDSLNLSSCTSLTTLNLDIPAALNVDLTDCSSLRSVNYNFPAHFGDLEFINLPALDSISLKGEYNNISMQNLPALTYFTYDEVEEGFPGFINDIDFVNAPLLQHVNIESQSFERFEIKDQPNLEYLNIFYGAFQNLSVTNCPKLTFFYQNSPFLDTLNLEGCTSLNQLELLSEFNYVNLRNCKSIVELVVDRDIRYIDCSGMAFLGSIEFYNLGLEGISLDGCYNLRDITLGFNNIKSLDFSTCSSIENINLGDAFSLENLILKNQTQETITFNESSELDQLTNICADEEEIEYLTQLFSPESANLTVNSNCPFVSPGDIHLIYGSSYFDINNDNCETSDTKLPFTKYAIIDESGLERFFFADENGDYGNYIQDGTHTYTPQVRFGLDLFTLMPENKTISLPEEVLNTEQDFCYKSTQDIDIVDVTLMPMTSARPGFDASYRIIYTNTGSIVKDGDIIVDFQDEVMDLLSAEPMVSLQDDGVLSWSFEGLIPFETRIIEFDVNLNSPMESPPLNDLSILEFDARVSPIGNYDTNVYWSHLSQSVVNSFDPNDKTCLNGDILTPDLVGDYLKYMIRFENTGSASAVNIVVTDSIDLESFDISTLEVIGASHDVQVEVDRNVIKFVFADINLPFDDANNDGFVTFKIKTLSTLDLFHEINNKAEIFFDFNFPIITNTTSTVVDEISAVNEQELSDLSVNYYPNPVLKNLSIDAEQNIDKVEILDINGKVLSSTILINNTDHYDVDMSHFVPGLYIIQLELVGGAVHSAKITVI